MDGKGSRGGSDQHHIGFGDCFLIRVKSHKPTFFRDINFLRIFFRQQVIAVIKTVAESIRHGYQFQVVFGGKGLYRGARATATAANQGDLYLDRKSVVEGKSVSVRVDLGGRRIIKKKK